MKIPCSRQAVDFACLLQLKAGAAVADNSQHIQNLLGRADS
jgi:hypothetical protein